MATWSYTPQEVMVETRPNEGLVVNPFTPLTDLTRTRPAALSAAAEPLQFRLRFTLVDSATATGMRRFYVAHQGAATSFLFLNPNDAQFYSVRFGSTMRMEHFSPTWFRAGNELVLIEAPNG